MGPNVVSTPTSRAVVASYIIDAIRLAATAAFREHPGASRRDVCVRAMEQLEGWWEKGVLRSDGPLNRQRVLSPLLAAHDSPANGAREDVYAREIAVLSSLLDWHNQYIKPGTK